ncbi:hypothetical protein TRICI_001469 [Trichomonascus ciferrii]|uniref:glucan 1,3-beta-glucosidase n=1 Tax=Trichomonascus ciferrii TaxID=44093 RepID=A0A642V991_9ASCO|nr:hypothetical protein TRICI_001469 [Trichomonascus ciferrii]
MKFSTLSSLALAVASAIASPITLVNRDSSFDYNNDLVRGVNLGGWFVIEPFISPSLFEAFGDNGPLDEYTYTQQLGKDEAKKRLEKHWSTWITENDIRQIAEWGFNHVRIPVGYWAFETFEGDPYVDGQLQYLDKALEWVASNGLHAWVDLHGAPGSQNGFDNSGWRDHLEWQNGDNVEKTLKVIEKVADRYASNPAVTAIEVLNEPLGPALDMNRIKKFFQDGYKRIKDKNPNVNVVIHDAFQPIGSFNGFMQPPEYNGVILDHHQYQVFEVGQLQQSPEDHVSSACNIGKSMHGENLWRITAEWSAAMTDCTKWLNGVGTWSRYEGKFEDSPYIGSCAGTDDINTWSDDRKSNTRKYVEAQMDAYDQGNGWIFWTYKTERSLEWDVSKLIKNGLFPQPLDDRQYQNQCGF